MSFSLSEMQPAAPTPAPEQAGDKPKSFSLSDLSPASAAPSAQAPVDDDPLNAQGSFRLSDLAPAGASGSSENQNAPTGILERANAFGTQVRSEMHPVTASAVRTMVNSQSPIGKLMDLMNIPQNVLVGATVRAADMFSPGVQKTLNPDGSVKPDILWHDVIDYYVRDSAIGPKAVTQNLLDSGVNPILGGATSAAYWSFYTGLGMAADVIGDPLILAKFGTLTKASKAAFNSATEAASLPKLERNIVEFGIGDRTFKEFPAKPVVEAINKAKGAAATAIEKVPGGDLVLEGMSKAKNSILETASSFDPWINFHPAAQEINEERAAHAVTTRGDRNMLYGWIEDSAKYKFTEGEKDVVGALVEMTPNLAPRGLDEEFKIGTKVLKDGKPTVVYHGTPHGFDDFNINHDTDGLLFGPGIYTTEDASVASTYAGSHSGPTHTQNEIAEFQIQQRNKVKKVIKEHFGGGKELDDKAISRAIEELENRRINGKAKSNTIVIDEDTLMDVVGNAFSSEGKSWYAAEKTEEAANKINKLILEEMPKASSNGGPNVRPSYLDIRNPIDMDAKLTFNQREALINGVEKLAKKGVFSPDEAKQAIGRLKASINHLDAKETFKYLELWGEAGADVKLTELIKASGFDGITHTGGIYIGSKQHKVWIALDKKQVIPAYDAEVYSKLKGIPENIGKSERQVFEHLVKNVEAAAKKAGVSLAPGRAEAIVDGALKIKKLNAEVIERRLLSKHISVEDLRTKMIENYLVHKIHPEAVAQLKRDKGLHATAEMITNGMEKDLQRVIGRSTVSSFDPTKFKRKNVGTLLDVNEKLRENGKVKDFFIRDPFIATALQSAETLKSLRDKALLETISKHGVRVLPEDEARIKYLKDQGYEPINHPLFEKKLIQIVDNSKWEQAKMVISKAGHDPKQYARANGIRKNDFSKTINVKLSEMLFPREIAQKISYDIIPGAGKFMNATAFMDYYNKVFRSTALFKPDYYLENWVDNILKNMTNGVKIEDWKDAAKILMAKDESHIINIAGKPMTIGQIRKELQTYDINSSTHFAESIDKVLFTGKKVAYEHSIVGKGKMGVDVAKDLVGKVFGGMHAVGTKGENYTRLAYYINQRRLGMDPKRAAFQVEKFLFDFSRTTAPMDITRRFYAPFIQAALKTARIAPELVGKNPALWNFYENNFLRVLEDNFNDPVTVLAVKQQLPDYFKLHDRVVGPLFPANHWVSILAGADPNSPIKNPIAIALGLPGGMAILNQFFVWNDQINRQNMSAPFLRSFTVLMTGKDPWTNKDLDMSRDVHSFTTNLNWATRTWVDSAIAMPMMKKYIMQKYGIGESRFYDTDVVLAFHASVSKFGKVVNMDKEYQFKMFALTSAEKALKTALSRHASAEMLGKTGDIISYNKPLEKKIVNWYTAPRSSAEVFALFQEASINAQMASVGMAATLKDSSLKPEQIAALIKNIQSTRDQLNNAYKTTTQMVFQFKGQALEELKRAAESTAK